MPHPVHESTKKITQLTSSPYTVKDISSMFSAYATVVLAVERFLAVSRPVEYHIMMTATGNRYNNSQLKYWHLILTNTIDDYSEYG